VEALADAYLLLMAKADQRPMLSYQDVLMTSEGGET